MQAEQGRPCEDPALPWVLPGFTRQRRALGNTAMGFESCCLGSADCVIDKIPQLGFWESREYEILFLQ